MLSVRIILPALVCALLLFCATQAADGVATYCTPVNTSQPVTKMMTTLDVRVLDGYGRCVRCSSLKRKNPRLLKKYLKQGVCLNMADEEDFKKICGLQITENRIKTGIGTTPAAPKLVDAGYKTATIVLGVFCGILLIVLVVLVVLLVRLCKRKLPSGEQETQSVPLNPSAPPEDDDQPMTNGYSTTGSASAAV